MVTRDIRTSAPITACDVCGRTLLRGERAHVYLDEGDRRSVCELCTSRALHEGWVREGTAPPSDDQGGASEGRRSLLGRLRARREAKRSAPAPEPAADVPYSGPPPEPPPLVAEPPPFIPAPADDEPPRRPRLRERMFERGRAGEAERDRSAPEHERGRPLGDYERVREPRQVRAIPSSTEQKIATAVEIFNGSDHCRTVAGVARSLGLPTVAVRPPAARPAMVNLVVSWELCWYRYEVDLSEDVPTVRVSAQGYELDELAEEERRPNAVADEHGLLSLAGPVD